jgi:lysophospholipase L1-like esterase
VILCLLTPISDYTEHKQSEHRPPGDILKLNDWLKEYAARVHATIADYYAATVDDKGMLKAGYSNDGLHPNDKGYALMTPVAEAAIETAVP